MRTYIAVLRGVNVGGNVLKMERLRELWSELGFKNVRTYVQSGNVVFEAESSRARFGPTIEPKLAGETRLPVSVIVRSATEMGKLIAINPFLNEADIDRAKLHVTFLASAPTKESLVKLNGINAAGDRFHASGKEIYLHCPDGYGNTKLSNNALEKALSVRATTRNWNTVTTLYQMAVGQVQSTQPRLRPEGRAGT
jgi:uncharacterized protein (DUF1697 family)